MALEPIEQFQKIVGEAKNVLIILPQSPDGDAVGSGWALHFFLKNKNIKSSIAFCGETNAVEKFSFLPKPENILDRVSGARDFVLSFNMRRNKIFNVRTESGEDELRIFITPERGVIDPRDFSFIPAKYNYDTLIALGSPDKETLGKIYEENTDMFFEVPLINIDNHSANDRFGQVNIVDVTASSVSEILAGIFSRFDQSAFDVTVSECLLSGIISATESFQKRNTTPKAFQTAAMLIDKGADRQKIVRFIYKIQKLGLLKLWGRVMARLKWDETLKLAWTAVPLEDFVQSRSTPEDLPDVLEKLKDNYSAGRFFLVVYQKSSDSVSGLIKCARDEDMKKISEAFSGEISQNCVKFHFENGSIEQAEEKIFSKLKLIS
jgi:nanoRNase/pAp phosphatase (c-di-AMP/oligoRNAs hydrolase)